MRLAREEKKGRFIALIVIFICIFLFFSLILVKAQLINGDSYVKASSVSSSSSQIKAARGQILDRNGNVLVGNRQGNDIIFDASKFPSSKNQAERNKIILSLIKLFERNNEEWVNKLPITIGADGKFQFIKDRESDIEKLESRDMLHLNKYATAEDCMAEIIKRFELEEGYTKEEALKIGSVCCEMKKTQFSNSNPYTFAKDVDDKIVSVIKENNSFYQGVDVQIVIYREYTDGEIAPHILGVTGVINAEEYAELKDKGYAMDDVLGKSGIEQVFEENLKGINGIKTVTTSNDGKTTTKIEGLKNGDNIFLTIDANLQKIVQDSLKEKCENLGAPVKGGSVVVMDCRTGEILAMASYPSYNLSTYYDDYNRLAKDTNSPLYNRATLSTYAPGSTAKVSSAIACLEEGIIDENSVNHCSHVFEYLGHRFVCQIGHANNNLTVKTALQDSCNSFFYHYAGEILGIDKMNMYRELLGLGQKTGVEIYESTGVLDSPSYRTSIGQAWMPGFSLQSAIGQAGNLFTPLQLCNYVATVANGGTRYEAHLIKSIMTADNSTTILSKEPKVIAKTGFSKKNLDIVKEGMRLVVSNGACNNTLGHLDVAVACKTGTSQVDRIINNKKVTSHNGFNISFAPYDSPEIAVAVAVEGAGSGASTSYISADIYNYYFKNIEIEENNSENIDERTETNSSLLR